MRLFTSSNGVCVLGIKSKPLGRIEIHKAAIVALYILSSLSGISISVGIYSTKYSSCRIMYCVFEKQINCEKNSPHVKCTLFSIFMTHAWGTE
jgi:hypothetical protein